jgi:Domain of unknown function (DUF4386)
MKTLTGTMQASMRRAGLIAGLGLLVMSILAGLATFGVLNRLVTDGDASSTSSQILGALPTFRLAILALLLIAVLDLVVAWALWVIFDPVDHVVAIAAACCRGAYAAIFAVAISHLLAAARLLGDQQPEGLADRQLHLEVLSEVERFYDIWSLGLGLFGFHLLLIGWLAFTSRFVPRFIGVLVAIAGTGYLIDSLGDLLSASYTIELASVTFIGEVVLMVWLLVFAARKPLMHASDRMISSLLNARSVEASIARALNR